MSAFRSLLRSVYPHQGPQIKSIFFLPQRTKYYNNRHVIEKWKKHRARKVIPVELPDFEKDRQEQSANLSPEEIRSKMKKKGIAPARILNERGIYTPCTDSVLEAYIPPEGTKFSFLGNSKKGIIYPTEQVKAMNSKSKIRDYEPGFNFDLFAENDAPEIYVKAHNLLVANDKEKIFDYVTEKCYPLMREGLRYHTIHWKLLGHIEPPKCVKVRCGDILMKGNHFGQITVRFHTKQMLAIYDRHGRLVHGSESDARDVLEYIVFEKHLVNEYGSWRIHHRVRTEDSISQISKTYEVQPPPKEEVAV